MAWAPAPALGTQAVSVSAVAASAAEAAMPREILLFIT